VAPEFAAQSVALQVLQHLERRRHAIVEDQAKVDAEVSEALVPVRDAYRAAELPLPYLEALEKEVRAVVPVRWRGLAERHTELEGRDFGLWRGGDVVARLVYVLVGLVVGGLCVALPFIPIWEKWFPLLLGVSAWWLPTAQVAWQRRRYARELGDLAREVGGAQAALEAHVTTEALLLPEGADGEKASHE
jgi:hypothetical protein